MKLVAVVQARMGSQRLPGKAMLKLDEERLLIDWVLQRVARAERPSYIVVATTQSPEDDVLVNYIEHHYSEVHIFRGSHSDVLSRFMEIDRLYQNDYLLRITADCPLVCSKLIDEMFDVVSRNEPIYAANCNQERILKGFDIEFIASKIFPVIPYHKLSAYELEHVTPYFYSGEISESDILNFTYPELKHALNMNLSIDTKLDLRFLRELNLVFDLFEKDFYQIIANLDQMLELQKSRKL